jgi:3',5'-cyclic AMP phosphodiesterase CpdA|tara:strand:+ start:201 stop:1007 length:807 start_codon:yes stop_codon:yes gene_type:complete
MSSSTEPFFFIQLSDTQFGLFEARGEALGDGTFPETALFEKAVAAANRLKPAFVIVTGDLVQDSDSDEQHTELMRIAGQLDKDIPIYFATGNCDVGHTPTAESLRIYRAKFGQDNYSFDVRGTHCVVLNSSICMDPSEVPEEWDSLVEFLQKDLDAHSPDSNHTVVFMHHPLFSKSADEPDEGIRLVPRKRRRIILDLLRKHGTSGVFAGHWHWNYSAADGDMLMVISGPVGFPLGDDPSGLRIVKVYDDRIEHVYFGMDDVPVSVDL